MPQQMDKAQLISWVNQYTDELYGWAFLKTADRHLAEDLVQETFLAAAEGLPHFRQDSHPKTWLFGILKNKIADHFRRKLQEQTQQLTSPEDTAGFFETDGHWHTTSRPLVWAEATEHLTDSPAFNKVLNHCLEHLPVIMQTCIRLKFLDEKKGAAICQELGISTTNYWQLVHRGKLQLRECLEKNWFKSG